MPPTLIVDLEGTCCDDGSIPDDEREVIEIGSVALDCGLQWCGEFSMKVRPVRHPSLTAFCTELTSIQQDSVDKARSFREVFSDFCTFCYGRGFLTAFSSWGTYDRDAVERDCRHHKILNTFSKHFDLARVFTKHTGKRAGRRRAMAILGLESSGNNHRALDDAKDVVALFKEMRRRGWL